MVEKGILIRTVVGVDAEELKRMRDEGLTNREIAENLGISPTTVQYWVKKLNLERRNKAYPKNRMDLRNRLYRLLKRNDPMSKREVMETLGLNGDHIEALLIMFPETFQKLNFIVSRRRYSKAFHDLSRASPVLTLKGDPRIVDFTASKIHMKVQTPYEAKSVVQFLKYQIGSHRARAVVERLGYRYKNKIYSWR